MVQLLTHCADSEFQQSTTVPPRRYTLTIFCNQGSQIRERRSYLPARVTHSEWVCGTCDAITLLAITLVFSALMSGCIYGWLGLGDPPAPVVLPPKWPTGWCHQRSEGSWLFALQFVVLLENNWESHSSPSPLGCWTSTEKGHNLVGLLSQHETICIGTLYNGPLHVPLKSAPSREGSGSTSNTWFHLIPTWVSRTRGILIGSAVFANLHSSSVCPTHRPRYVRHVYNNRPHPGLCNDPIGIWPIFAVWKLPRIS